MWFFNFRSSKTRLRLNPPKVTVLTVNQYVTRKVINFHTNNSIPRYMTTNKVHDSYIILQHLNPSSHHPHIHPRFHPHIHGQKIQNSVLASIVKVFGLSIQRPKIVKLGNAEKSALKPHIIK